MISETAIEELDAMKADGLDPTPRDIVRLNALGLKLEAARNKRPASALDYLPRVAVIADGVSFRQPTIAHEIWLAKVGRFIADDCETLLAVRAYALSRAADTLPDPDSPSAVRAAVEGYAATMGAYTRDQILAAVSYAVYGASSVAGEFPPPAPGDGDGGDALFDGEDWSLCVAAGVLAEAQVVLLGLTAAEIGRMTRKQVDAAIEMAMLFKGVNLDRNADAEVAAFYATSADIRKRLESERAGKTGNKPEEAKAK